MQVLYIGARVGLRQVSQWKVPLCSLCTLRWLCTFQASGRWALSASVLSGDREVFDVRDAAFDVQLPAQAGGVASTPVCAERASVDCEALG